jgi:hypothetical protein
VVKTVTQLESAITSLQRKKRRTERSGKARPGRLDTATRMMVDEDFSLDREVPRENRPADIRTPVNKRNLRGEK